MLMFSEKPLTIRTQEG